MASRITDPRFSIRLRELIEQHGMSYRSLAARTHYGKSYLHDIAHGTKPPTPDIAQRLDDALSARGELVAFARSVGPAGLDDEMAAIELARRVAASDLSADTLAQLEHAFDDLATSYATTPPAELLPRVRSLLAYVAQLMDARKTLAQHRQLLVVGGWLSLLAATVHIDLRQQCAASARLNTAAALAGHAEHAEIRAWCLETQAWEVLTAGDYPTAVGLSQQAQQIAPRGSSAHIQATAQEGRAWARMGEQRHTRAVLDRVAKLVSTLQRPDLPEHHYRYDPDKALSYTGTTLAWAGDPAAEEYTRTVIGELEGVARPRRIASARLDLGLALLAAGKPDEAADAAVTAITSGRVVPSNWWRATEIVTGVRRSGIREAEDLRDAYTAFRPPKLADSGGQ